MMVAKLYVTEIVCVSLIRLFASPDKTQWISIIRTEDIMAAE